MADQDRLKIITDNIEQMYKALKLAAANISGLLQIGKATCDEIKAYNLWALATYNTQAGMLATLRANGENAPEFPTYPTLFTWKGVSGEDAWNIDCAGQESSLSGAMGKALRGPSGKTVYLSSDQVQIVTQDQFAFNPTAAPSFNTLYRIQEQRAAQDQQVNGLGLAPLLLIAIAGITVGVGVAIAAIMKYLETSEIQESNSKQVALQADAFAKYTEARLQCFSTCTGQGKSTEECVDICAKIVDKPDIDIPGFNKKWGWLQWTGFTVVAGVGSMIVYKAWQRKQQGRPVFELPEF